MEHSQPGWSSSLCQALSVASMLSWTVRLPNLNTPKSALQPKACWCRLPEYSQLFVWAWGKLSGPRAVQVSASRSAGAVPCFSSESQRRLSRSAGCARTRRACLQPRPQALRACSSRHRFPLAEGRYPYQWGQQHFLRSTCHLLSQCCTA